MQLTIPCVAGTIHNLVALDYAISSCERRRDPRHSDSLGGERGARGILRGLLRNSFSCILTWLLWHRSWTHLIECLYDYWVLGIRPMLQNKHYNHLLLVQWSSWFWMIRPYAFQYYYGLLNVNNNVPMAKTLQWVTG